MAVIVAAIGSAAPATQPPAREAIAARVLQLTRESRWTLVRSVPLAFRTFHPQGLVKIGDTLFVSSVEVRVPTRRGPQPDSRFDRDTGDGIGHLFKVDLQGRLLAERVLGEGSIYHPGGIDFDGTHIWVPVAEYRPDSRSIVYRVDPQTLAPAEVVRVADHIGAIVHDTGDHTLHGASWGSRRFYRWQLTPDGRAIAADAAAAPAPSLNPSHYVDYQDCDFVGEHRMLCTGVSELRSGAAATPFRLGGLELIDLRAGRPLFQTPVLLWTKSGLDMTHNPSWFEATADGLRAYFLPEDDTSTLYIYDVTGRP